MKYLNLGHTGLHVSRLCLGTMTYGSSKWRDWVLDEEQAAPFFRKAFEIGINFFDTADMYSLGASEEVVGRAIREHARRDDVVLATKVNFPMSDDPNDRGLSRKHILSAIDRSLQRLGTDYVDLYQIHRFDPHTPIEETMQALHDVVRAGKARYLGASSMFVWQFAKMQHAADLHGWRRFVSMQNHYNLVYREGEPEMIPFCIAEGVAAVPWSPPPPRRRAAPAQIALASMLHKPGVTAPIIGASKMSHLDDAVAALEIALSEEEIRFLEEPYRPHAVLGHS